MELDRHRIERKDFEIVRRGYDPGEVDLHLREIADAVAELKAELRSTPAGVAGAAAEHVKTIVEAAEKSAAEIEAKAEEEARRLLDDSARIARETRERADRDSADQLQRVQEAARAMLERGDALEEQLESIVSGIQSAASALVEALRNGAGELERELGELRQGLLAARPIHASGARRAGGGGAQEGAAEEAPGERAGRSSAAAAANGLAAGSADEPEARGEVEGDRAERGAAPAEPVAGAPAGVDEPQEAGAGGGAEGARLIALNMALNGTPREEAARYLADNFDLEDRDAILDDVYSRVGGRG
ncbi:MAG: DivIVA domain-containing protein [Thermoleophilaceae bacterium]|nr:DivIVA domain-containing protein [Thermoleophilaceae bacterium]